MELQQSERDMYNFFHKQGFSKAKVDFYKENCSVESDPRFITAVSDYTGFSNLEIMLSLGIVPEEYKETFYSKIHEISGLLYREKFPTEITRKIEPIFLTDLGTLYNADCIDVLRNQPDNSFDLIFADPPFNLSKQYDDGIQDDLSMSKYVSWCYKWMDECVRTLKPGGSLFIYNIPKWGTYYADFLNKRLTLRSWIGVNMKFSLPLAGRLYPAHYSLLYYIKGSKPTVYHNQRIPLDACRHCGGELHDYGGYKSKMNPKGVNLSDIWSDIYPVRHKNTKNRAFNELSVKMLDRIITMTTNPGDLVFDPFGGSGTTYIVAEMLNRRWVGSELGNCTIIQERFNNIEKDIVLLEQAHSETNRLFTDKTKALRRKNGFWLSEDFEKHEL